MRETMDPMTAGESSEKENFANRKLIRPTLPRVENNGNHNSAAPQSGERRDRTERHERHDGGERVDRGMVMGRRAAPPDQPNAENFNYRTRSHPRPRRLM